VFVLTGAAATAILLRREWAPKVTPYVPPVANPPAALADVPAHR
jgi:hypothetical protein